ncbi:MAG: MarR family transcriptional regulator [Candidatus Omnitrophica bacterium]|nr:MarR family transcriptional regulator [Candidatus Omnitrophota bacterium]
MKLRKFAERISYIHPSLMKAFVSSRPKDIAKISLPQILILEILLVKGKAIMSELANDLRISTAGTTGLADRMIAAGYLKRYRSKEDRRLVYVEMTAKGRRTIEDIRARRLGLVEDLFKDIPEDERCVYLNVIEKIHQRLKQGDR